MIRGRVIAAEEPHVDLVRHAVPSKARCSAFTSSGAAAAVKRLGLNKIRYRLDTLRFAVPESARTALVDAKRDARQMKLL